MTNNDNSYSDGPEGGAGGNGQVRLRVLQGVDLVGGTLVEYQEGEGFRAEYLRGAVTANAAMESWSYRTCAVDLDWFTLPTTKFTYGLNLSPCPELVLCQVGRVYLWRNPGHPASSVYYAVAPAGVVIPGPEWVAPHWEALQLQRRPAPVVVHCQGSSCAILAHAPTVPHWDYASLVPQVWHATVAGHALTVPYWDHADC